MQTKYINSSFSIERFQILPSFLYLDVLEKELVNKASCATTDLANRIHVLEAERTKLKKELETLQNTAQQRIATKEEKPKTTITAFPGIQRTDVNIQASTLIEMPRTLSCGAQETVKKSSSYIQSKNDMMRQVVQMDNALNKVIIEELESLLREKGQQRETENP